MKKLSYIFFLLFLSFGLQAQVDRTQPKPGPAPKVNVGKPQTFELKNGLKVMVVENHKLPQVSITLSIDNPPYTEGDKKGVNALIGALLGNGTSKISKEDYQEEIDFMGADLYFNSSGVYASTLSRYFPRVIEMIAAGITDPKFTQDDLSAEIAKMIDGLKSGERSVQANAARVENVLAYGANHPFGEFETIEKFGNITLTDVQNQFKTYFVPNNAYLIIVGDVKFKEVKSLVEKNFNNWKAGKIPTSTFPQPKNVAKTEINFVDMPNAVQSEIAVFNTTNLKMTDPDYFAALVANQIYGGNFNSYLNMNLREDNGWTYGARSSIRGSKNVNKFKAGAQVRNEVTDSAVFETMKELNRIRTEKVTDEILENIKATLIGNFVMDAEKPEVIARLALISETQSLPDNFYQNYIQSISAVTKEDVMKAAQKYFLADNARILVVGKGSDVLPGLERLGYTINYFDRFGNPTTKPQAKQIDANVTVKTVIDNYINSIGGTQNLSKIKSVMTNAEGEIQGMKFNIKSINTTDGKSLTDFSMMGQSMSKSVFNGKTGYSAGQGQRIELEEKEINDAKFYSHPFPELNLASKTGVTLAGIENINGSDAYVVVDGKKKLFFDIKSGLKVAEATAVEGMGDQTIIFDEYKDVKGVKYPHKMTIDLGGMEADFIIKDIKINEGVTDADFM